MAKTHDVKADWQTIDPDTLNSECREAYDNYKAAYRLMKEARQHFEDTMATEAALPAHLRLVFGYNFGKLSIAAVPAAEVKPKATAPGSLSVFLASTAASGRRV
jgi:hypothetical protein